MFLEMLADLVLYYFIIQEGNIPEQEVVLLELTPSELSSSVTLVGELDI